MFRPFFRLGKKGGRLRKHKPEGEFPILRRSDYSINPLTVGVPSKPSSVRDLDDPKLDNVEEKPVRRAKPHVLFPRDEKSNSVDKSHVAPFDGPSSSSSSSSHILPDVSMEEAAKKFHWMPHPKSKPQGDEYFAKYFLDRDRRADGKEEELKKLLDELPDEAKNTEGRISPRKFWYTDDYESPKLEDVPYMRSVDVKKIMMEEAHLVRKGSPFKEDLWQALAQRGAELASGRLIAGQSGPQCGTLTTLRLLQALASVQVPVNTSVMQIVERVSIERRLKPQHYTFFLQALSRLKLRDARLFPVVEKMSLLWGVLRLKQLVKVSNAVAKLDVGGNVWVRPLKEVLAKQLPNLGEHIQRLKSISRGGI